MWIMIKIIKKGSKNKKEDPEKKEQQVPPEEKVSSQFSKNFDENFNKFKEYLQSSDDVVFRQFTSATGVKCGVIFIDGLVSKELVQMHVIRPLMQEGQNLKKTSQTENNKDNKESSKGANNDKKEQENSGGEEAVAFIIERIITAAETREAENLDKAMLPLMSGETVLLVDGYDKAIIVGTREMQSRGVQEPVSESVVRGPREGFTEVIRSNTALIRRRVRDPNLVQKTFTVGRRSKTPVVVSYIKGIANPKLVERVEKRIKEIDIDDLIEAGEIEQFIEDNNLSPFPQIQNTERPDKAAAALMEGRVVIMVDGTPFVLIMPANLYQFFQSPEDYYERWIIGSILRSLRWLGSLLATFAPAIYVAIISFHPGMLPTTLVLSVAASRQGVPFPAFVEALLMEVTIELLREAGARLPKAIGQTIGIVGGIIVGDAAVRAGITSPFMVIIVAITAISSFIIPSYSAAIAFRVIRFPIMILAATLGMYGILLSFIFINIHLVVLKSFGANYMSPVAPVRVHDWKDTFVRVPLQLMRRRPEFIDPIDIDRYRQDPVKEV